MTRAALLLVLLLPAHALGATDSGIQRALGDLSSPFEESRRRAVAVLARGGREATDGLRALYPNADFRTKALVLEALGRAAAPEGLGLVRDDVLCGDRGVVRAQHEYLSALYGGIRDDVSARLAARVRFDWRTEEALRCLPGPGDIPRAALESLSELSHDEIREDARRISAKVAKLDGFRDWLRARAEAAKEDGGLSLRLRSLSERLLRHDVERAMLAVHEAGSEGYYDGMYRCVRELVQREGGGGKALRVLVHLVKDEPWPENGVPGPPDERYRNLEPVPRDLGRERSLLRSTAAQCLGDVGHGDPEVARELSSWLEARSTDYQEIFGVDYPLALALAGLGETGPLADAVVEFRHVVENLPGWRYRWERCVSRLAASLARLGRYTEAAEVYRDFFETTFQTDPVARYNLACVLAKAGKPGEALEALALAIRDGYGDDPSQLTWLERDGDLDSLREEPEYERLLEAARRR